MHAVLKYDMALDLLGQSLEINTDTQFDIAGDAAHGNMKVSSEALGQSMEAEMYTEKAEGDKYTQYMSTTTDGTTTWTKTTTDTAGLTNQLASKDLFKDAKLEKTDSGYKITVPGKSFSEVFSKMGMDNYTSMMGDNQAFTDALEKSEAVYTFDKDCLLTGMEYSLNLNYGSDSAASSSSSSSEEAVELNASMKFDIKMTCSDYGKIDASKVAVPEDVKKSAVDGGETSLSSLTGGATSTTTATDETAADATASSSAA